MTASTSLSRDYPVVWTIMDVVALFNWKLTDYLTSYPICTISTGASSPPAYLGSTDATCTQISWPLFQNSNDVMLLTACHEMPGQLFLELDTKFES